MPKRKSKKTRAKTIRRKRRAVFGTAPKQLREDVLRLMPISRRQTGRKLKHKLAEIKSLRHRPGDRPKLAKAIKELAALVRIADKKKKRAQRGSSPRVVRLTETAAKAADNAVKAELVQVNDTRQALLSSKGKGGKVVRANRALRMSLLTHKKSELQRRRTLLANRLDFVQPVKLHPGQVTVQRKPLKLPIAWVVPDPAEVAVTIRLFGSRVKRLPGENDVHFGQRLKSFTQRGLVRLVQARVRGVVGPTGIEEAFTTTLAEDSDALAAEAAVGGVVTDEVAETMNDVISPVEDYIDQAVEEQVEVPSSIPSPEDLGKLILTADSLANGCLAAPREEADDLEIDLIEPDAPLVLDGEDEDEWELVGDDGKPTTTAIAVGVAGLGLIWFLSGR